MGSVLLVRGTKTFEKDLVAAVSTLKAFLYLFFRDGRSGPIFQGGVHSFRANLEAVLFLDMHEALKTRSLGGNCVTI